MNAELAAFKAALRRAGQPWSGWGVRTTAVGIVGLLCAQLAPPSWSIVLLAAGVALVAAGWGLLVAGVLKRRRWAQAQPLRMPEPGAE